MLVFVLNFVEGYVKYVLDRVVVTMPKVITISQDVMLSI